MASHNKKRERKQKSAAVHVSAGMVKIASICGNCPFAKLFLEAGFQEQVAWAKPNKYGASGFIPSAAINTLQARCTRGGQVNGHETEHCQYFSRGLSPGHCCFPEN